MYNTKAMNNNWTKPTIEELGDASNLILGATGSNIKDDNLDDGFTREGISIGQS
tara:strand:+ start:3853 stop:4014 length:162 start_codon:yes stop_codon:yes gene_type:complete